ncbi:MAG: hypothetical protein IPP06_09540 [Saprospiraceae bacterium]|nr:hypothetical protein [Candidatus Vicinibacter affinis]
MLSALLNALRPFRLVYFRTNKPLYSPGDTVWLSWQVNGVLFVEINGIRFSSEGVLRIDNAPQVDYTLLAESKGRKIIETLQLNFSYTMPELPDQKIDRFVCNVKNLNSAQLVGKTLRAHFFGLKRKVTNLHSFAGLISNREVGLKRPVRYDSEVKKYTFHLSSTLVKPTVKSIDLAKYKE